MYVCFVSRLSKIERMLEVKNPNHGSFPVSSVYAASTHLFSSDIGKELDKEDELLKDITAEITKIADLLRKSSL